MIDPKAELTNSIVMLNKIIIDLDQLSLIEQVVESCVHSLKGGGAIFFCGNGGSAADSQHLAAELVGKLNFNRSPLCAVALTVDTSILTAVGNDYGFEHIFARQLQALGKKGDILIALSTSGNSRNVIEAIYTANGMDMVSIGFTGAVGGNMLEQCKYLLRAPSDNTQHVQEAHIVLGHIICSMIEERMFA